MQPFIEQGDVYWIRPEDLRPPAGRADTGGPPHPHVVIQADVLNHSRIETVVVCALTSNVKRLREAGNVFVEAGEANLPQPSVAVVSQISTVDKTALGEPIGKLSEERVQQILAGLRFQQKSFFDR